MRALADRALLLRELADAGKPLLVLLTGMLLLESLVPAATAVTLAVLVSRVSHVAAAVNPVTAPLVAFGVVLLLGHVLEAAKRPVLQLAQGRMDGAHRARVAALASTSQTIEALERPEVQQLIRETRADPRNWTERSAAQGALTQLELLICLVGLLGSCAVLASYAWWPVPLLVAAALGTIWLSRREAERFHHRWRQGMAETVQSEAWEPAIHSPGEGKDVRIFGFGDWVVDEIQRHIRAMFEPTWALVVGIMRRAWVQGVLVLIPLVLTYVSVAVSTARGHTSAGMEMAVFSAAWSLFAVMRVEDVHDTIGGLASLRAYGRLRQLLASGPMPAEESAHAMPSTAPLVRLEDITFAYADADRPVLDRLNLEVRPGELLGVVGLNGAGKSTVIKLLAGLYTPASGRITVDGMNLADLGVIRWRQRISVVFQDFVRYHLSAEDNVALGRPGVPRHETALAQAAADAGLRPVLDGLPRGWQTPLARTRTDGVDLSGGQWQQVVLARALYAVRTGARLLVLDEPTAHLDVRTEFDMFSRIAAHKGDASVVLISHRLSTVRQADRIVLLEGGRVTECGTHDELMALRGAYAEMFAIQAERFARGYDDRNEEDELT